MIRLTFAGNPLVADAHILAVDGATLEAVERSTGVYTIDLPSFSEADLATALHDVFIQTEDPTSALGRYRTWSSMSYREAAAAIFAALGAAALAASPAAPADAGSREALERLASNRTFLPDGALPERRSAELEERRRFARRALAASPAAPAGLDVALVSITVDGVTVDYSVSRETAARARLAASQPSEDGPAG